MATAPPPRPATRCLLLLNGGALLVAAASLSATLTIDAAGPVGRSAQTLAASAAVLAALVALLGCATATAYPRYLYVYFVSQLAACAACAYVLGTVLGRVDTALELKSLQFSSRAPNWRDDSQLLGVPPSGLDGCDAETEELSEACWEALRPALRASLRRRVLRVGTALLALQLLALLAAKWVLTLPVIVVRTEIAIAYATLTLATILAVAAVYESFRVETAFGMRLVGWCAGAAALLFVQSVWGLANTLLARRIGRWRSGAGEVGRWGWCCSCSDGCFGASRLASLAVMMLGTCLFVVLAVACSSRPDALLKRVQSGVTDAELQGCC